MRIEVKFDAARFAASLDDVKRRQLPFAVTRALTLTAKAAQAEITGELPSIFERPTSFTMNALAIKPATKSNMVSAVFAKPIQAKYLLHEEVGGIRLPSENTRKPSQALVLPSKLKLNQYGNIPYGALKRLFEDADQCREQTAKQKRRRKAYAASRKKREIGIFYLKDHGIGGRGPGGIFKRLPNHQVQRLISFEATTKYSARFGYRTRITAIVSKAFTPALLKCLQEAKPH